MAPQMFYMQAKPALPIQKGAANLQNPSSAQGHRQFADSSTLYSYPYCQKDCFIMPAKPTGHSQVTPPAAMNHYNANVTMRSPLQDVSAEHRREREHHFVPMAHAPIGVENFGLQASNARIGNPGDSAMLAKDTSSVAGLSQSTGRESCGVPVACVAVDVEIVDHRAPNGACKDLNIQTTYCCPWCQQDCGSSWEDAWMHCQAQQNIHPMCSSSFSPEAAHNTTVETPEIQNNGVTTVIYSYCCPFCHKGGLPSQEAAIAHCQVHSEAAEEEAGKGKAEYDFSNADEQAGVSTVTYSYCCPFCHEGGLPSCEAAMAHCQVHTEAAEEEAARGGAEDGFSKADEQACSPAQPLASPLNDVMPGQVHVVACDSSGQAVILRQKDPATGTAQTIVKNDDGTTKAFGNNTVASLLSCEDDEADAFMDAKPTMHLRALLHEVSERLCDESLEYHAKLRELKEVSAKLNYAYFDLEETASHKDLEAAYRTLARKMHPDKNGGSHEAKMKFQQMKERYEALRLAMDDASSESKADDTQSATEQPDNQDAARNVASVNEVKCPKVGAMNPEDEVELSSQGKESEEPKCDAAEQAPGKAQCTDSETGSSESAAADHQAAGKMQHIDSDSKNSENAVVDESINRQQLKDKLLEQLLTLKHIQPQKDALCKEFEKASSQLQNPPRARV